MQRHLFRWLILVTAIFSLAYGFQRKHTITVRSEDPDADDTQEQINDAGLVVFATYSGVVRAGDGQFVRVLSATEKDGPQACPT